MKNQSQNPNKSLKEEWKKVIYIIDRIEEGKGARTAHKKTTIKTGLVKSGKASRVTLYNEACQIMKIGNQHGKNIIGVKYGFFESIGEVK